MIKAKHYQNDIENCVAIEYTNTDMFVRIQFESLNEAKDFKKQLEKAIDDMEYYG